MFKITIFTHDFSFKTALHRDFVFSSHKVHFSVFKGYVFFFLRPTMFLTLSTVIDDRNLLKDNDCEKNETFRGHEHELRGIFPAETLWELRKYGRNRGI